MLCLRKNTQYLYELQLEGQKIFNILEGFI